MNKHYILPLLVLIWNFYGLISTGIKPVVSQNQACAHTIGNLEEVVSELSGAYIEDKECISPWIRIGGSCIFTDMNVSLNWHNARAFCKELKPGADLVTYKDANEFADLIRHFRAINAENRVNHFWIGGSDLEKEEEWIFVDGTPMPMGSPFWGSIPVYLPEPQKSGERCAFFYFPDRYYAHNTNCDTIDNRIAPVCQFHPTSKRG